ncbi:MAG TPA: LytTR family DNA-binding domain-containing protein [Lysobacter sp.]
MTRAFLVDDERIARAELRRLLQAHPGVEILGEATDAADARTQLAGLQPDVVFLDIEMPGESGITFARSLPADLRVVICTAHSAFASEAFEINATDYLMKPIAPERLARTVARLGTSEAPRAQYLPPDFAIILKFNDIGRIARLKEIERFESVGNYIAVHCRHGAALIVGTISRLEQRLDPSQFLRANRSEIVRIDAIINVEGGDGGGLDATLESGKSVEISRRQAQLMRARMAML